MNAAPRRPVKFTRLHWPFPRHDRTVYILFDGRPCVACAECVIACPRGVLGLINLPFHRHAHVDDAAACVGCGRCIAACPQGCIRRRTAPQDACPDPFTAERRSLDR